jgi:hypothetical protein
MSFVFLPLLVEEGTLCNQRGVVYLSFELILIKYLCTPPCLYEPPLLHKEGKQTHYDPLTFDIKYAIIYIVGRPTRL